jgi:hypothetical protein
MTKSPWRNSFSGSFKIGDSAAKQTISCQGHGVPHQTQHVLLIRILTQKKITKTNLPHAQHITRNCPSHLPVVNAPLVKSSATALLPSHVQGK